MNAPKNIAASVKARLQNVAAKRGDDFNLLLLRYGIERLLFRLCQSSYADRFLLKGAMLFVVWDEKTHRPTRDLDLLGFGPSEKADLIRVFQEVAATPVVDDGIVFDPKSVQADEIREDHVYGGVRVRLMGKLGTAEVPVQIDVGAGDAVTPAPEAATFPALLDFPAPHVRTYPVYTVVAEKFEAMVKLGTANTRMKDFHDVWFLAHRFEFDGPTLRKAIEATFVRRQTILPPAPEPFTEAFANDPIKQAQWSGFLRRNGLIGITDRFGEVVAVLRKLIEPVLRSSGRPPH
ncbi:MAG TPA: nucleotidyl transferase AbiEii/AbiGii toxin family protein [Opitutaceae bacterium]|nr:nucleotidyl transferase AbiEii/AbiGii toxin family protein [Opitutaceae bacterium]